MGAVAGLVLAAGGLAQLVTCHLAGLSLLNWPTPLMSGGCGRELGCLYTQRSPGEGHAGALVLCLGLHAARRTADLLLGMRVMHSQALLSRVEPQLSKQLSQTEHLLGYASSRRRCGAGAKQGACWQGRLAPLQRQASLHCAVQCFHSTRLRCDVSLVFASTNIVRYA